MDRLFSFLQDQRILILGFGREGRSTYDIIRQHLPEKELGIADVREIQLPDPRVTLHCGPTYLSALGQYSLVIKTPGVSLKDVALPPETVITCQTDLFLRFCDCPCVGVTGTKGKTIVSTLLYEMLCAAGRKPCLIGSIGVPVLDSFAAGEYDIAVVEMSCHQLEFTTASPHVAVLTNLYAEHLDHYHGFGGYARSKMNILRYQNSKDFFICNAFQPLERYVNFYRALPTVIKVSEQGCAAEAPILTAARQNPYLPGRHSLQNVMLAAAAARCLGVEIPVIAGAVRAYRGVPNRLELLGSYGGIRFYNDVLATIPEATQCAIEAIPDADTLIFGGASRAAGYDKFADYLAACSVRHLIGLPDSGTEICAKLRAMGCDKTVLAVPDMEAAVEAAFRLTSPGKSCILSCAASSYNVYMDYEHKGAHFKRLLIQQQREQCP